MPESWRAAPVAVLNAGGWGTALAVLLGSNGHAVSLWCRRAELAEEINATRENLVYLPGVQLPRGVRATADPREAVADAQAILLTPISRAMRETVRQFAPHLPPGVPVAHAAKGFEPSSRKRLSEVVSEELGDAYDGMVAVLSGPTHAEEVARGLPTAAVVACADPSVSSAFQALLHGPTFRVYTSSDVAGVEVCAALKNVIALAVGGADGLGYGDNARAGLITRALAELGRLVEAMHGDPRTVSGLAGLGDVVATCTSRHSRNRRAGEQLGRGQSVDEVLASTRQVVEGIPSTRAAMELARAHGVELPICELVYRVLYEGAPVRDAINALMGREPTTES